MKWTSNLKPPFLVSGDVVLPARGEFYDAALADGGDKIVPSSQLFVLRPRKGSVTPEFLCWYLNQPVARRHFLANRKGTSIPMISRQVVADLPVPVPPPETQRKVVALQRLADRERKVTEQLLHNREVMLNGIFKHLLDIPEGLRNGEASIL